MQGIKFNTQAIQAILDGRKTQTRRPIKLIELQQNRIDKWWWKSGEDHLGRELWDGCPDIDFIKCYSKYKIGETVFVQEEFIYCQGGSFAVFKAGGNNHIDLSNQEFIEQSKNEKWENSSELNECYARIFLKITNIKVERLQDISEEDCIKEGGEVACLSCDDLVLDCNCVESEHDNHKDIFRYDIWNNLPYQPQYDWNSNPYVFVYEFEVIKEGE